MRKGEMHVAAWSKTESNLDDVSPIHNLTTFCDRLIGAVRVAFTHRDDVDEIEEKRKMSQAKTNDRHSKITLEEPARKWNVGLETACDAMKATTHQGIQTATEPMLRCIPVDHLDSHQKRLKG